MQISGRAGRFGVWLSASKSRARQNILLHDSGYPNAYIVSSDRNGQRTKHLKRLDENAKRLEWCTEFYDIAGPHLAAFNTTDDDNGSVRYSEGIVNWHREHLDLG